MPTIHVSQSFVQTPLSMKPAKGEGQSIACCALNCFLRFFHLQSSSATHHSSSFEHYAPSQCSSSDAHEGSQAHSYWSWIWLWACKQAHLTVARSIVNFFLLNSRWAFWTVQLSLWLFELVRTAQVVTSQTFWQSLSVYYQAGYSQPTIERLAWRSFIFLRRFLFSQSLYILVTELSVLIWSHWAQTFTKLWSLLWPCQTQTASERLRPETQTCQADVDDTSKNVEVRITICWKSCTSIQLLKQQGTWYLRHCVHRYALQSQHHYEPFRKKDTSRACASERVNTAEAILITTRWSSCLHSHEHSRETCI